MSKFIERLKQVSQPPPPPMGFGAGKAAADRPQIQLVVSVPDSGASLLGQLTMADAVLVSDKPLARLYDTQNSDWNAKEVYLDPSTGQKAQDQVNPEYLDFEIYPDAEFNDLNLQPWWWSSTTTSTTTTT